jgi:hypothetical protein
VAASPRFNDAMKPSTASTSIAGTGRSPKAGISRLSTMRRQS